MTLKRVSGAALIVGMCLVPVRSAGQVLGLEIVKIHEGVYGAIREMDFTLPSDGNSLIVIGDDAVLVVDTNITPASARAVIAKIRELTPLPVRYVINTHDHSDHVNGNGAYRDAYPGVTFIGHDNMRKEFLRTTPPGRKEFIDSSRALMAKAPGLLASGKNGDGTPMSDAQRMALQAEIAMLEKYVPEIDSAPFIAPDLTVSDRLTLHMAGREIELLYLGRGNTAGDLVVYLPKERVVATGDLLVFPLPFAYDSFVTDWAQTMKKVQALDAATWIPGHGPLMRDRKYLDLVARLLDAAVTETAAAKTRGATLEEALKSITLDALRLDFTNDDRMLNAVYSRDLVRRLVRSAWGVPAQ